MCMIVERGLELFTNTYGISAIKKLFTEILVEPVLNGLKASYVSGCCLPDNNIRTATLVQSTHTCCHSMTFKTFTILKLSSLSRSLDSKCMFFGIPFPLKLSVPVDFRFL